MAKRRKKLKPSEELAKPDVPPAKAPDVPGVRRDPRRWIYGGLDLAFAITYGVLLVFVMPNRLPLASLHLWTLPIFTAAAGVGMLVGGRIGWWIAVAGGSAVLLSIFGLILRILISAAFLSGVYGAFGKGAVVFAIVLVALVVELVGLLPIIQVKYLMSRAGRRTYGMS